MTVKKGSPSKSRLGSSKAQAWIDLARLRFEKCELLEAEAAYVFALKEAKKKKDLQRTMEALGGLLRLAGEALNQVAHAKLESELDSVMAQNPDSIPPWAWYCKAASARHNDEPKKALIWFRKCLSELHAFRRFSRSGN